MITKDEIRSGEAVYAVRVVPNCEVFEVLDLVVHSVTDDYFTAIDTRPSSGRTYIFNYTSLNTEVFYSRVEALTACKIEEDRYYTTHKKQKFTTAQSEE